jgi:hypothetical protein
VPESAVPRHRSAGAPPVRRSYVPEPCRVMTPGGAEPAAVAEPAGRKTGWAGGQRNRSHPGRPWPGVLLSVAFWKPGRTDVLRTVATRDVPCSAYPLVSAFDSGRRRAVCKTVGSAYVGSNPTPATTSENGPRAAETRPGGRFLLVTPCISVYHCESIRRGVHGRIADGVRTGRAVGDTVGFPRTATDKPGGGPVSCL